jgi:hypothetical protein
LPPLRAAMNGKIPTKRTKANYLGQLGRLATYRYGNHYVPENDEGRAMLMAQLRCKLKDDDAKERAPWITAASLETLKRQAKKIDFKKIGELVGLKHRERWHDAVKMFSWPACDISPEDAERYRRNREREMTNKRQKKFQESIKTMRHTDRREESVLLMLRNLPRVPLSGGLDPMSGWTPVSDLVKEAERCAAFRRPDGRPQSQLRKPVHRVIETLKANGQIETAQRPGTRGMVMYVRLTARELAPNLTYLRTKVTDLVIAA